jgi:hypothetical protein
MHKILALRDYTTSSAKEFLLAESRVCPTSLDDFVTTLGENETFETDFIGASEKVCQQFMKQNYRNFITTDQITIADARTAKDGTILIQVYQEEAPLYDEDVPPWPGFGILPPRDRDNTWWSYRVNLEHAPQALLDLGGFGVLEAALPYYGYKDRLTDKRGVFNVTKAGRITLGEDPETVLREDSGNPQA